MMDASSEDKPLATSKLFPLDKNYILREAQFIQRQELLTLLVNKVISSYRLYHNPLGLVDTTVQRIQQCENPRYENLYEFYNDLAGIHRFQHPDNQLEFIFDGSSHFEKFKSLWYDTFTSWLEDFCKHRSFLRAVLEAAVLYPEDRKAHLAENRFKVFLAQFFKLKVYKYKGIQKFKSA